MLPWQPFFDFYIWGAHWRHPANTTELSMCGGSAVLCQITLTTCFIYLWQINDDDDDDDLQGIVVLL